LALAAGDDARVAELVLAEIDALPEAQALSDAEVAALLGEGE
jgi:hypothetical protein